MRNSVKLVLLAAVAGLLAILLADSSPGQDKGDKKPNVIQLDLSKLPPDVAKRLIEELTKAQAPAKGKAAATSPADKGKAAPTSPAVKAKASASPSDGKPSAGKPSRGKPSAGKKPADTKKAAKRPTKGDDDDDDD
jgi:hypothetical protein